MKKLSRLILFFLLIAGTIKGWYWVQKGFQIQKISPFYSLFSTWSKKEDFYGSKEQEGIYFLEKGKDASFLQDLFSKPIFYLGKGQQCFVFSSFDQKYAVKFIRKDKLHCKPWLYLPLFREKKSKFLKSRDKAWGRIQGSLQIVTEKLARENEVVSVHLGKTQDLKLQATLVDAVGRKKKIKLDQYDFIIQRKAEVLSDFLKKASSQEKKEITDKLLMVTLQRSQKKIRNKNRRCLNNMGIYEGKVIEIDLAEFSDGSQKKEAFVYQEVQKSLREYSKYLQKQDLSAYTELTHKLALLKEKVAREKEDW